MWTHPLCIRPLRPSALQPVHGECVSAELPTRRTRITDTTCSHLVLCNAISYNFAPARCAQITDTTSLAAAGLDTTLVARRATEAYLLQILRHGFLHAGAAENILLLTALHGLLDDSCPTSCCAVNETTPCICSTVVGIALSVGCRPAPWQPGRGSAGPAPVLRLW